MTTLIIPTPIPIGVPATTIADALIILAIILPIFILLPLYSLHQQYMNIIHVHVHVCDHVEHDMNPRE